MRGLGLLALSFTCACTGSIETLPPSSTSSGNGLAATGGQSGVGGMGGFGGVAGTAGAAGGSPCPAGSIEIGSNPIQQLPAACLGAYGANESPYANGYLAWAGKGGPQYLQILGCRTSDPNGYPSVSLSAEITAVGSINIGMAEYRDQNQISYSTSQDVALKVITFQPPGGLIAGEFSAVLTAPDGSTQVYPGKFSVCHVSDMPPPP